IVVMVMVVIVVVLVGGLALGLRGAAAQHALAAGLGGAAVGAGAAGGGLARADELEAVLGEPAHDDRDVAGALADARRTTLGPRAPALEGRTLVGVARRDVQLVGDHAVVVLGVGDGRLEALEDHAGDVAL